MPRTPGPPGTHHRPPVLPAHHGSAGRVAPNDSRTPQARGRKALSSAGPRVSEPGVVGRGAPISREEVSDLRLARFLTPALWPAPRPRNAAASMAGLPGASGDGVHSLRHEPSRGRSDRRTSTHRDRSNFRPALQTPPSPVAGSPRRLAIVAGCVGIAECHPPTANGHSCACACGRRIDASPDRAG